MNHEILSPEEFFGFTIGTDRNLARWDTIIEYFEHLDEHSSRVEVRELGKSTEGNPFLLAVITSAANLKRIERLREISLQLAHPQGLSEDEVEELVEDGKVFVSTTNSVHASEVGGTQMASQLAFELATSEDPAMEHIRQNTVFLLIPSANPDGNHMIVDWYNEWLGTPYEGSSLPYLYHKYVGHDNNRDCFNLTQKESKLLNRFLYQDWYPQAHIDHHHMGSFGARFNIPPHKDPVDEHVDPLVWIEQELYGSRMLLELETSGKTGVETQSIYHDVSPTWAESPCLHGICGMLTESASVNLATPKYIHPQQVETSSAYGRPEYRPQIVFPHPWPGGWWKLRDIVVQQKIATIAALKAAATNRKQILRNMYLKALRQIKRGNSEKPFAFALFPDQHDPLTALKLLQKLQAGDVTVHQATEAFEVRGMLLPKGTYVIFTSQPCRPLILKLLQRTLYHDGPLTRKADDTPIPPYDLATDTLAEFMGIDVMEISSPLDKSKFEKCKQISFPDGEVETSQNGYLIDGRLNESFKVVNSLLNRGIAVSRVLEPIKGLPVGSFYIPSQAGIKGELAKLAAKHHVTFQSAEGVQFEKKPIHSLKIGIYRRYWGGNMDEGWTRWLLEDYGFPYESLRDEAIEEGNLSAKYDVIILPSDPKCLFVGNATKIETYYREVWNAPKFELPEYPPEYRSGISENGLQQLHEFVKTGGTLITFGQASEFAMDEFDLPLYNPLAEIDSKIEFFCPGSILKVDIDTDHSLAYGVNESTCILFGDSRRNYPVFDLRHSATSEDIDVVLKFPERSIPQSGWLIGENHLSKKAALVSMKLEEGTAILFAFHPQFRAQTEATFKFLFNALLN